MRGDDHDPFAPVDRRGAVARLTEALAAAQAAAHEGAAELDRAVGDREAIGGDADTGSASDRAHEDPRQDPRVTAQSEVPNRGDGQPPDLRGAIALLPSVDSAGDESTRSLDIGGEAPDADSARIDTGANGASSRTGRLWPIYVVMAVLVLAVPSLIVTGFRIAGNSTAGEVLSGRDKPDAPGYTALVEPTPVALVIHVSKSGEARSLAVLSLSGADQRGGAILGVPVNVRLSKPRLAIDSFAGIIDVNRPQTAAKVIGSELGLGFTDVVKVTDAELEAMVEPVAPLKIDNPETVTAPDDTVFDNGDLELSASDVPRYLAAVDAGNTASGALTRQQLVWEAWVKAIARRGVTAAIPGETEVGLGRYLAALSEGKVQTAAFPSRRASSADGEPMVKIDRDPAMYLIANAVPFPVAALPRERATVALLNGTGPTPAPTSVIQRLTYAGAQITTVGNARTFDQATTTLTYTSPLGHVFAKAMADELGVGRVLRSQTPDTSVDVIVVLGTDIMTKPPRPMTMDDVRTP